MILSKQQTFSDGQAITGTARSTNVIDLGLAGTPYGAEGPLEQDVGKGNPVPILVQVTEAFNTLTSLSVAIETGADDTLGTVVVEQEIALADLQPGNMFPIQFLPININERFLGLRYTVTGTDPTQGAITAAITMGNQTNRPSA